MDKRYIDIAREASYALWNALLTVNGILLAVFSVLAVVPEDISTPIFNLIFLFWFCCLVSITLIVPNFSAIKKIYQKIGKLTSDDLSNEQEKENLEFALRVNKYTERRELAAKTLLFGEFVLIILIFIAHQGF